MSDAPLLVGEMDYEPDRYMHFIWTEIVSTECRIQWVPASAWLVDNSSYIDSMLASRAIHVQSSLWPITHNGDGRFNYSAPLYISRNVFLNFGDPPSDEWADRSNGFGRVFTPSLWAASLGVFALLLCAAIVFRPLGGGGWRWFGHYIGQDTTARAGSAAASTLLLVTGIFTVHSLSLFEGGLLTSLVREPVYEPQVHSVDDLIDLIAANRSVLNLVGADEMLHSRLQHDQSPNMQRLRAALQLNPPVRLRFYTNTGAGDVQRWQQHDPRMLVSIEPHLYAMEDVTPDDCGYSLVDFASESWMALVLLPDAPAGPVDCLARALHTHQDMIRAEIERFSAAQKRLYRQCRRRRFERMAPDDGEPLPLNKLAHCFAVLAVGAAVAVVGLAVELGAAAGRRCCRRR